MKPATAQYRHGRLPPVQTPRQVDCRRLAATVAGSAVVAGLLWLGWCGLAGAAIPVYGYAVKNAYPHDPGAFTQGLVFEDGFLYESTGLNGQSSVRKVQLETGKVLMRRDMPAEYFGEGIALVGQSIVGLTWRSQVGFVWSRQGLVLQRKFAYAGEGWGLGAGQQRRQPVYERRHFGYPGVGPCHAAGVAALSGFGRGFAHYRPERVGMGGGSVVRQCMGDRRDRQD
jgi:hypothetical protein